MTDSPSALYLSGPGKPAIGFQSKLPTTQSARRRFESSQRPRPASSPAGTSLRDWPREARHRQLQSEAPGPAQAMSIVPAGLLQIGDDDELCVLPPPTSSDALSNTLRIWSPPFVELDSPERGARSAAAGRARASTSARSSNAITAMRSPDPASSIAARASSSAAPEAARRTHAERAVERDDPNPGRAARDPARYGRRTRRPAEAARARGRQEQQVAQTPASASRGDRRAPQQPDGGERHVRRDVAPQQVQHDRHGDGDRAGQEDSDTGTPWRSLPPRARRQVGRAARSRAAATCRAARSRCRGRAARGRSAASGLASSRR